MEPSHQHRTVLAGLFLLLPACFGAPAKTAVTAVRFWTLNDATRIVIEASGDFEFTSDRVNGPDRIFFDVKGARMRLGGRGPHTVTVGDHLLKQVRIAETQPGVTRVVFDLEGPVDFTASQLTNPNRLIVELRPAIRTPLQTAEIRPLTREVPFGSGDCHLAGASNLHNSGSLSCRGKDYGRAAGNHRSCTRNSRAENHSRAGTCPAARSRSERP